MPPRRNQGADRLASALDGRMSRRARRPPTVDLATVRGDLSLLLDHFAIPIPADDYIVTERFLVPDPINQTSSEAGGAGDAQFAAHDHDVERPDWLRPITAGDRVLVHILDADSDSPTFIVADRLMET